MEDRSFLLMKLGFVFAAPLAGFIFSYFNFPTSITAAEEEDEGDEEEERSRKTSTCYVASGCGRGLKYELFLMQNEVATTNIIHRALMKSATMSTNNIPSNPKRSEDDERGALCLPEVNRQAAQQETVCGGPSKEVKIDSEIQYLRKLAQSLCNSNRSLAAVRELENQLKANSAESLCLSLQIEKFKGENERLKSEALEFSSEFSAMKRDLESSKSKVKQLKMSLKAADEQAKAKIASLEHKIIVQADVDLQNKMIAMRLKELEDEDAQVRKEKAILERLLESAELSISALEDSQAEVSKEMDKLREINGNLEKTIEQLRSDRAAQSEELVYLRKKQLILQYAEESSSSSPESQCQSEVDYSPTAFRDSPPKAKKINSRKSKFLNKLKKLVLRKGGSSKKSKISPTPDHQVKELSDAEEETAGSKYSFASNVSCFTEEEEEEEEENHQPAEDKNTSNESTQKL